MDRQGVRERLGQWARSLADDPQVLGVVLFGSHARGDATAASDADVLVVLRDSAERLLDRIPRCQPSGIGVSVDVSLCTLTEARGSLRKGWGAVPPARAEGQVLCSADEPIWALVEAT